ncbi:MAG TPA: anaerobic sulfatase maturase [Candidatus Brocadiia bacterium]|nr:anaerobic sulfatase maturase [Candidatus Brocadiia bacterium]
MVISKANVGFLLKPVGAVCNLRCDYCYYRRVMEKVYSGRTIERFSPELLERIVSEGMKHGYPTAQFSWQGGEPLLAGKDFYREALLLQKQFAMPGQNVTNAFQTNGTLLDDQWCAFLRENNWLVGISLDGPPEITDQHRIFPDGCGASEAILSGLSLLQKHRVDYNILSVVSPANADRAPEVYRYLRDLGVAWMQFIPSVERTADSDSDPGPLPPQSRKPSLDNPGAENLIPGKLLAAHSVSADAYGEFLCDLWDTWIEEDGPGRVFVRDFEAMLSVYAGHPLPLCVWSPTCAWQLLVEHNGDVYPCDHHAYHNWRLGNLLRDDVQTLIEHPLAQQFEGRKRLYSAKCRGCEWLVLCHGGCPKHRMAQDENGTPVDLLCEGYRRFFAHSRKKAGEIVRRLLGIQPIEPAAMNPNILERQSVRRQSAQGKTLQQDARSGKIANKRDVSRISRNSPCPCGSGRKFKQCCGR